jgi:hypothetical protein
VLFVYKCDKEKPISYPIPGQILRGGLERKNASLEKAERDLVTEDTGFFLNRHGKRSFWSNEKGKDSHEASFYARYFKQGATIVPRSFWFVRIKPSHLGFDTRSPLLETDPRAMELAKKPYRDVRFEGNVENGFLYATLLSTDLIPFGHLDYRLVVLPIEPGDDHYVLIDKEKAGKDGLYGIEKWLEKAEEEWAKRRGAKAEQMNIYERLDRVHGLTHQNPQAKYRVIYNTSGTNLTAAVVRNEQVDFGIGGQVLSARGFIVDHVTYFFELSNSDEASFLASVFNSPLLDKLLKPMQARGLFGPRHVHKKIFELPIPQFKMDNPVHSCLAELGKECTVKVEKWIAGGGVGNIKSIGRLRGMVRKMLGDELKEIDKLVKEILG